MPLIVRGGESESENDFGLGWLVRVIWVESSVMVLVVDFSTVEC